MKLNLSPENADKSPVNNVNKQSLSLVIRSYFFAPILLVMVACSSPNSDDGGNNSARPEGIEKAYNATPVSYSGSTVTITATAQFQRYDDYETAAEVTSSCGGTAGNPCIQGLAQVSTKPIRRAEYQITNSSGSIVQAGETDNSGGISAVLPLTLGNYTLVVNSRSYNSYLRASILNNPYDKTLYSITKSFSLTGSESGTVALGSFSANYTNSSTLEGGAFNILDNLLMANEFLRAHANANGTASTADYCPASVCNESFTVAPKVSVYWTKGLTPAAYYGDSASPISFFVGESGGGIYQGLYILGGIEGDVCVDTDHFDNSVILHEYGHYLEYAYATSDSPGGSHNGNKVIDPRLAWSEGWANYFQAAVLGRTVYRDTTRNAGCAASTDGGATYRSAKLSFSDFQMEAQTSGQDYPGTFAVGEGNFREMSIARTLFDLHTGSTQSSPLNVNTDSSSADLGFALIWKSFRQLDKDASPGSGYYGRQIGHFLGNLYALASDAAINNIAWIDDTYASPSSSNYVLVKERQRRDRRDFGRTLNPTSGSAGTCSGSSSEMFPFRFYNSGPVKDSTNGSGQITWSDLFNSNDMWLYYYDGSTDRATVKLHYKLLNTNDGSTPWDLDLYAYQDGFTFLSTSDIVRKSEAYYPETTGTYPGYETISFSGLSAGYYWINIKVDYSGSMTAKGNTEYYLQLGNGEQLCP